VPVPQTDTGRRGENPKVIERTLVKELAPLGILYLPTCVGFGYRPF